MLNLIWSGFFFVAFASGLLQFFSGHQPDIFARMMKAGFDNAKLAVAGGLIADLAGFIAAVFVAYLFFGGR